MTTSSVPDAAWRRPVRLRAGVLRCGAVRRGEPTTMREPVTSSADYEAELTCDLFTEEHRIMTDHVEVLEEVAERAPVECEVEATGCGSCYTTDAPAAVFWVAQDPRIEDELAVKFDVEEDRHDEDFTRHDLGVLIYEVADEHGVDVDWTGSPMKCVFLGTDEAYDTSWPIRRDDDGEDDG